MRVAFDVDGTLIDLEDKPREDVIETLRSHVSRNDEVFVWSGGGKEYAEMVGRRIGLTGVEYVYKDHLRHQMDVCYDDCDVKLATMNVKV